MPGEDFGQKIIVVKLEGGSFLPPERGEFEFD